MVGLDKDSATHVWLVLFKAAHAVERNARASIAALGLGLSDFAVLELLLHKGPQPVNWIGRKVLLSSGSITAGIDRLEARELVRRVCDPGDLRSRIVQLTEAGRKLAERAFAKHALDIEETMSVMRPSERSDLVRLLKKLGIWAAARIESEEEEETAEHRRLRTRVANRPPKRSGAEVN
jgi:MarR family 2-MHQ and catechol resistance regulon transcriptional repressor